jgi:gamma-glutamyl-gamma-aminobutyrate hydrolase PuuD
LFAQALRSTIKDSDLTDCLLLGTKDQFKITGGKPNKITRPVVALAWNYDLPGAFASDIQRAIRDFNAIPLRFNYEPSDIDIQKLDVEVKGQLQEIAKNGKEGFLSIGEKIIKTADPDSQTYRLVKRAQEVARYSDAIAIPGGFDIQPELYGKEREIHTYTDEDFRRSIYEFGVISQANEKKIPMIGVCRGSQIINVFFGGTLKQDVDDQFGEWQELKPGNSTNDAASELFKRIVGTDKFYGLSMHHQASDQIGTGLTKVMDHEGVTKAIISNDGNFILTQFHPEIYFWMDEDDIPKFGDARTANKNIFTYFFDKANESRRNKSIVRVATA